VDNHTVFKSLVGGWFFRGVYNDTTKTCWDLLYSHNPWAGNPCDPTRWNDGGCRTLLKQWSDSRICSTTLLFTTKSPGFVSKFHQLTNSGRQRMMIFWRCRILLANEADGTLWCTYCGNLRRHSNLLQKYHGNRPSGDKAVPRTYTMQRWSFSHYSHDALSLRHSHQILCFATRKQLSAHLNRIFPEAGVRN